LKRNKFIIPVFWIVFLAFVGALLSHLINKGDREPINLWKHNLQGEITKASFHRGFIKLEENIWISQNLPEIYKVNEKETGRLIDAILPPYELKKSARDSVFLLLKDRDSLYFKMIRYDTINDPTFSQLFRRWFKD